jgi:hypothetical protein
MRNFPSPASKQILDAINHKTIKRLAVKNVAKVTVKTINLPSPLEMFLKISR